MMDAERIRETIARCDKLALHVEAELRGSLGLAQQYTALMQQIDRNREAIYEALKAWRIERERMVELLKDHEDPGDWWKRGGE